VPFGCRVLKGMLPLHPRRMVKMSHEETMTDYAKELLIRLQFVESLPPETRVIVPFRPAA
jgi:hypothetical protein